MLTPSLPRILTISTLLLFNNLVLIACQENDNHSHVPHGLGPCVPDANGKNTYTHKKALQDLPRVAGARTPCEDKEAAGYPCLNIDLESFVPSKELAGTGKSEALNDVWGWTDPETDVDYAIVGMLGGTSFVELADPNNPKVVGYLDTHTDSSNWRDAKTYKNHAFIVSEASGHGMQVYDLTTLPGSFAKLSETAHYDDRGLGQAHNVFINEESGIAYIVGAREDSCSSGGLHMVDVSDPANPVFAGCYASEGYTHDVQCIIYDGPDSSYTDKEICFASNEDRVVILDATDKKNVKKISTLTYQRPGYTHQGWLTEDRRHFLVDDETDEYNTGIRTKTVVVDVSDLDNPTVVKEHMANNRAIDHNLYVKDGLVYQANYQAGLRVLDLADVANGNLVEKAYFDIYPESDRNEFNGAWSNYPFFDSGIVVVSGIESGLFVVTVDKEFPDENDDEDVGDDNGGNDNWGNDNWGNDNWGNDNWGNDNWNDPPVVDPWCRFGNFGKFLRTFIN